MKLAIFHCQIKIISRGKGKTATAAAAYRSGTKIVDDEFGETHDYTRKGGVAFSEILLCANAPSKYSERQILWNEVQKIEKQKNAQLCREIEVALPIEFSRNEQIEVVREYIKKNFTDKGMIADWSLHDKSDGNPHAHILLTMRPLKPNGEWGAKRKDSYVLDDSGNRIPVIDPKTGKQKIGARGKKMWERISVSLTDWNDQTKAEEWRKSWADICNEHLKGQDHIDHRSYARQGKKQLPTIHEGYVARKIAKSGRHSNIISYNQQVRQHNALEQANEQDIQTAENELKQLENELEKIKSEQKGQEQDGFSSIRRDFAELLARGKKTIDGFHGSTDNGKREQRRDNQTDGSRTQRTGTTDTDNLIRQSKAVSDRARAELSDTRPNIEQSKSENTSIAERQTNRTDETAKQPNAERRRRSRR